MTNKLNILLLLYVLTSMTNETNILLLFVLTSITNELNILLQLLLYVLTSISVSYIHWHTLESYTLSHHIWIYAGVFYI